MSRTTHGAQRRSAGAFRWDAHTLQILQIQGACTDAGPCHRDEVRGISVLRLPTGREYQGLRRVAICALMVKPVKPGLGPLAQYDGGLRGGFATDSGAPCPLWSHTTGKESDAMSTPPPKLTARVCTLHSITQCCVQYFHVLPELPGHLILFGIRFERGSTRPRHPQSPRASERL